MVEGVLTGNITSHTHSYIPLSDKGLSNGKMPYYVTFPSHNQLVALGYNEESTETDDEYYLKGLCKWAIDNYANQGYILLIGMAQPNSIGYCHIQLYSSNGKDTNTGLPRYCAGMYCSLLKTTVNFVCREYKWYWKGSFLGNAETASKWATPRTITLTGSVTGSVSLDGSANVSLATTTNHAHDFSSITSKPTTIAGYGITDAYTKTETDNKLSGYLPLSGGTMTGAIVVGSFTSFGVSGDIFYLGNPSYPVAIKSNGTTTINGNTLIHSGNIGDYAMRYYGTNMPADIVNYVGYGKAETGWGVYGPAISFGIPNYYTQIQRNYNGNDIYVRGCYIGNYTDWKTIAFTDSNVASATKLQDDTAYTAWGQTFFENGKPKNVSGDAHITGDLIVDGEVSALVA